MHADLLITNISQLATPAGAGPRHGPEMGRIDIVADAAIAVHAGRILWAGARRDWGGKAAVEVDAAGRAIIPALIDPHTHAVWRGDRLLDFEARSRGARYEEILALGGGIRTTIHATNLADGGDNPAAIAALAGPRIEQLVRSGAGTIEIKSGYGFTREGEIRLLEAIALLRAGSAARIVATLLIHVPPSNAAERAAYIGMVTDELIPEAARRGLASAVDVFIEREAFGPDEARQIFAAATRAGLAVKAHADQFNAIGGVELAIECNALSVDHLEASGAAQIAALAGSKTIATLLPGASLHLGAPAAPGRALIDAGAAVAVATDLNPGSAPVFSTQLAMALAVRINRLTVQEALTAATANAAAALGLNDVGRIAAGHRASFLVLDSADWRDAIYILGANPVARVFLDGKELPA